MSKSAQRKNRVIAEGRQAALSAYGWHRDSNPYYHPRYRALWYQGWDEGAALRRKQVRVAKRKRRSANSRLWRAWYVFVDIVNGEWSPAQTPVQRPGRGRLI